MQEWDGNGQRLADQQFGLSQDVLVKKPDGGADQKDLGNACGYVGSQVVLYKTGDFPAGVAHGLKLTVPPSLFGVGLAVLPLVIGVRFAPVPLGVAAGLGVDRVVGFVLAMVVGFAAPLAGIGATDLLGGSVGAGSEVPLAVSALRYGHARIQRQL